MISEAEAFTNAELRIHLEAYCKIDVIKRAVVVFKKLKMHKTIFKFSSSFAVK